MLRQLILGGNLVDVTLKDIKNIHLSVHPPTGRIRISAPMRTSFDTIRVFAISKLDWIKRHQTSYQQQEREPRREYIDRESHYAWGRRYLLKVIESAEAPCVDLKHNQILLSVRPGTEQSKKHARMEQWYREQIKEVLPPLIAKWEPILSVKLSRFFVQRMRTKWGSCNVRDRSIRLNTDLAKKPPEFLEYVLVHEMAHLIEAHHNQQFGRLMDGSLANWRMLRETLNSMPLSYTDWVR